jgi:very-short-patch-repair endonuclease
LPEPETQYPVYEHGRVIARLDLAYPDRKLAIEADGYRWHAGRARWQSDLARRNRLTALGWRIIHVTWSDLRDRPDEVVERVRRAFMFGEATT